MIESTPTAISRIAHENHLKPNSLQKQYRDHLSDFREWEKNVNEKALVYPENFGEEMAIDETGLHQGELYTIITNRQRHGKKGSLAGIILGTKNSEVSKALECVSAKKLMEVKEVTADFAESMDWICRTNFMNAKMVGDRFHAQKIVTEAVQEIRIELRRKAINEENRMISEAKSAGKHYESPRYRNDDTKKQLLARSRYILFKPESKWSLSQIERAKIFFEAFPELRKAYDLSMCFRNIYETAKTPEKAAARMKSWLDKINSSSLPTMISAGKTIDHHLDKILNYFPNRTTNASAESFNAKLKGFRSVLRGIRNFKFFLYRLEKLYA